MPRYTASAVMAAVLTAAMAGRSNAMSVQPPPPPAPPPNLTAPLRAGFWQHPWNPFIFDESGIRHDLVPSSQPLFRQAGDVPLPGVKGRLDHMAVDVARSRLYVAALGNNTLEVVDLKTGRPAGRVEGPATPQGVCVLPSGNVVVASGGDGKCRMYDPNLKLLATQDGLADADNVRYDPAAKRIYVGYGNGGLAILDAGDLAKLGTIPLPGHPESFALETGGNRIFVNVPSAGSVAVIDRRQQEVTDRWELESVESNFPLALDESGHRLFVACRRPARLLVLDTDSGRTIASRPCCDDADDVFFDAANWRVYVSGGEGLVSVFDQVAPDSYVLAGKIRTAAGARTSLFVPEFGRLFVAAPARGEQPAQIQIWKPTPRKL